MDALPDDGLDNLVVAHQRCNNSKRDFLAGAEHVESWVTRSRERRDDIEAIARGAAWQRDEGRSRAVATAIYFRLPVSQRGSGEGGTTRTGGTDPSAAGAHSKFDAHLASMKKQNVKRHKS